MASFASITAHDDVFDIPLEGVNREEEEDNRTQLEKDINSPSAVIPIQPWRQLKDNMEPNEYARQLLDGKEAAFGQDGRGVIRQCDAGGGRCGSFFWRLSNTVEYERFVPIGWINYGGIGIWTMCPLCNAIEVHEQIVPEAMRREQQLGRWDQTNQHGTTGSTDNDKQLLTDRIAVTTPVDAKLGKRNRKKSGSEIAEQFWKDKDGKSALNAEAMKRLKDAIREDENKNRLDAAERRREDNKKQKTSGGKRRRKKRTKKRRKSRRRKRTRKRRKSRRRKRTRKRR